MPADTDLLTGLAQELEDAGVGTYNATGAYAPGDTATVIVFGGLSDSPARMICLATYGPSDDHPEIALGVRRVQVRIRGLNYLDAVNLDNACFDALHGLEHRQYGITHANQILRLSGGPLGMDASKRWEMASNYQVDLDTPPTALRPQ